MKPPQSFRSILPQIYEFLPDFFSRELLVESKSTCEQCAMCLPEGVELQDHSLAQSFFSPNAKCCTFFPELPNYLIGGLLQSEEDALAEGRRRIKERIKSRIGVTPAWLLREKKYNLIYQAATKAFGRSESLLCPYFNTEHKNCSIWLYRESVCSTFFCKHDDALDGAHFWRKLKRYLSHVEKTLALHAVRQLSPAIFATRKQFRTPPKQLSLEDIEGKPRKPSEYKEIWQDWEGREMDFYTACYACIRDLSTSQVEQLLGFDGQSLLDDLQQAYEVTQDTTLPTFLILSSSLSLHPAADGGTIIVSYSRYDPTHLPSDILALLREFNAQEPAASVQQRISDEHDIVLTDELLLRLYRLRILVDANNPTDDGFNA